MLQRVLVLALLSAACAAPESGAPSPTPRATAAAGAPATAATTRSPSPSEPTAASTAPVPAAPTAAAPTPGPSRSAGPTGAPKIAFVAATQHLITIGFDRPMKSGLPCGESGAGSTSFGTIDNQRSGEAGSLYSSNDRALTVALSSATRAEVSSDCMAVTFELGYAAPAGRFTITARQVEDLIGGSTGFPGATASVEVVDEGERPTITSVEGWGDNIYVRFSEPMLELGEGGGIRLWGNYRWDDRTLTPSTQITCLDPGCAGVRIWLPDGTFKVGEVHDLRVANVVDRSGMNISPDPTIVPFLVRPP